LLNQTKNITDKRLVVKISQIDNTHIDSVGQKMANLGEMKNILGLNVPDGFVFTACAFESFFNHNDLQTEIYRLFKTSFSNDIKQAQIFSSKIQQIIINAEIPLDLKTAVEKAIKQLKTDNNKKMTLALRSSSLMEDMVNASFAGQYKSLLNISVQNIFQAYKEVIASKYSTTAIQYRLNRGLKDEDTAMCVGCLARRVTKIAFSGNLSISASFSTKYALPAAAPEHAMIPFSVSGQTLLSKVEICLVLSLFIVCCKGRHCNIYIVEGSPSKTAHSIS